MASIKNMTNSINVTNYVKPVLSFNKQEARSRVIKLYKAWYKQIPYIEKECRARLKQEFLKNRNVTDIRVIDMLVMKGQMELVEVAEHWQQKNHVMAYFRDSVQPKPEDFLSRFYLGKH